MREIFADSVYWIALINPADQWFRQAHSVSSKLAKSAIVTTNDVLTETLNFYAGQGAARRDAASSFVRSILLNVDIEVLPSTQDSFLDGLHFTSPGATRDIV